MPAVRLRSLPWLLALAAVFVLGLFSYVSGRSYLIRQEAVREALATRAAQEDTLSLLKDAETGTRGFLLTGDEKFLEPYDLARPRLLEKLSTVGHLGERDDLQRAGVRRVRELTLQKLAVSEDLVARKRRGTLTEDDALRRLEQSKTVMDAIRVEIAQLLVHADLRLDQREQATERATLRLQFVLGAALFGAVLLTLVGWQNARREADVSRRTNEQLERDVAARKAAENRLREQSKLLESVLAGIGDAVVVVDHERTVLMVNPAAERVAPFVVGGQLSVAWSKQIQTYLPDGKTLFPPELGPITRALQGIASDDVEMLIRVRTGALRSYIVTTRPMSRDGTTGAAVAVFRDSTDLKLAAKELAENEQRYRILSDASFEGVAITREGKIQDSNANFAHWLGYERSELVGMVGISFFSPEERQRVQELALDDELGYESRMLRRDGSTFPVEVRARFATFRDEQVRIAVVRDVTEKKRQERQLLEKSEQLRALSLRDELTGLHNRRGFMEVAEHQLKAAARARESCAVFFADLNGMKLINDQLGHETGDHAIRAAAEVLTAVFRASDVVARLGGDEFAIFAGECDERGVASTYARVEHAVSELNATSTCQYRLSISVGAALFRPQDPPDLLSLMHTADANMYDAKRARHSRASLRVRSG
jgi:diguanylate cyclase (GGDEF)-like protein/PAS domain S-box-containing protein